MNSNSLKDIKVAGRNVHEDITGTKRGVAKRGWGLKVKHVKYFWLFHLGLSLALYFSVSLQRNLLFLHRIVWPLPTSWYGDLRWTFGEEALNLYDIENVDLEHLKGYSVEVSGGGWNHGKHIIFFHGNAATRALR